MNKKIKNYFSSELSKPYFCFLNDEEYRQTMSELQADGVKIIRVSDMCGTDRPPNMDKLIDIIKGKENPAKMAIVGLGEYLAISGFDTARDNLNRLQATETRQKVVLLLRGVFSQIPKMRNDRRFDERVHYTSAIQQNALALNVTVLASDCVAKLQDSLALQGTILPNFKALLAELEKAAEDKILAITNLSNVANSTFEINKINNAHDAIKWLLGGFNLSADCADNEFWQKLFSEILQNGSSLENVFRKRDFIANDSIIVLTHNFHSRIISQNSYANQLYFICLKSYANTLKNDYLKFVVKNSRNFDGFAQKIMNAILEIQPNDRRFLGFYEERKNLIRGFSDELVAKFINAMRQQKALHYLTDSTELERFEVIRWLNQNHENSKNVKILADIYPKLAEYSKKYTFKCGENSNEISEILTEYFEEYKRQKIYNRLEEKFLAKVDTFAKERKFNRLPTREEILAKYANQSEIFLYWLDALGVEYLSFIEFLATEQGLSTKTEIARAELPTITRINRQFFDNWQGEKNGNNGNKELDKLKHKEIDGYDYTKNPLPIHLTKELEIISTVIEEIARKLKAGNYQKFLLTSDHGASRLAVLREKYEEYSQYEKYKTETKGENSGRCCKIFENYEPQDFPFATQENDYIILADYGRFKGSRRANVEVHGGATLEEVVVPVIEFSLKKAQLITVQITTEIIKADRRNGIEFEVSLNKTPPNPVILVLNNEKYTATPTINNKYNVKMPNVKKAGTYQAEVHIGNDLINTISIKVQGAAAMNDDFSREFGL
ncbi:MAG: BREX-4 system phosphatase PglZ [Defluviitaleaceae bacterium]|nr:BREX-4 system phosphatase PglZ [Defluviitaleaceae bacterium]